MADSDFDFEDFKDALWLSRAIKLSGAIFQDAAIKFTNSNSDISPTINPNPHKNIVGDSPELVNTSHNVGTNGQMLSDIQHRAELGKLEHFASAPAIPNSLDIARAFRPLKRRVKAQNREIIDVQSTSEATAEVWINQLALKNIPRTPVIKYQKAPARRIDLSVIYDSNPSMVVWEQVAIEFSRLMNHHGAFGSISNWSFDASEKDAKLYRGFTPWYYPLSIRSPYKDNPTSPEENNTSVDKPSIQVTSHYKTLITPGHRHLIVIISDCIGACWHNGAIGAWIRAWSRYHPTIIIQMLPYRQWHLTALGKILREESFFNKPVISLLHWLSNIQPHLPYTTITNYTAVPVIELERFSIEKLTRQLIGESDEIFLSEWLPYDPQILEKNKEENKNPLNTIADRTISNFQTSPLLLLDDIAQERIRRFQTHSSTFSFDFAQLLAAWEGNNNNGLADLTLADLRQIHFGLHEQFARTSQLADLFNMKMLVETSNLPPIIKDQGINRNLYSQRMYRMPQAIRKHLRKHISHLDKRDRQEIISYLSLKPDGLGAQNLVKVTHNGNIPLYSVRGVVRELEKVLFPSNPSSSDTAEPGIDTKADKNTDVITSTEPSLTTKLEPALPALPSSAELDSLKQQLQEMLLLDQKLQADTAAVDLGKQYIQGRTGFLEKLDNIITQFIQHADAEIKQAADQLDQQHLVQARQDLQSASKLLDFEQGTLLDQIHDLANPEVLTETWRRIRPELKQQYKQEARIEEIRNHSQRCDYLERDMPKVIALIEKAEHLLPHQSLDALNCTDEAQIILSPEHSSKVEDLRWRALLKRNIEVTHSYRALLTQTLSTTQQLQKHIADLIQLLDSRLPIDKEIRQMIEHLRFNNKLPDDYIERLRRQSMSGPLPERLNALRIVQENQQLYPNDVRLKAIGRDEIEKILQELNTEFARASQSSEDLAILSNWVNQTLGLSEMHPDSRQIQQRLNDLQNDIDSKQHLLVEDDKKQQDYKEQIDQIKEAIRKKEYQRALEKIERQEIIVESHTTPERIKSRKQELDMFREQTYENAAQTLPEDLKDMLHYATQDIDGAVNLLRRGERLFGYHDPRAIRLFKIAAEHGLTAPVETIILEE